MYAGPASGATPILSPLPPDGQLSGAITGDPLMPSPTSGSSPASMIPIFAGHPESNALEWQVPPEQLIVPPLDLIAYRRPLANERTPVAPTAPSDVEVRLPAFMPPSSPVFARYSSLLPTTIVGLPSISATAGVSISLPWSSSIPGFGWARVVEKLRWSVTESTAVSLSGSATSTGNPGSDDPARFVSLGCQAYRWRSSPATMMSRTPLAPLPRCASTGEERNPPSVRSRGP